MDAGIMSMGKVGRRNSNYRQLQRFAVEEHATRVTMSDPAGGTSPVAATGADAGDVGLTQPLHADEDIADSGAAPPQLDAAPIPSTSLTCGLFAMDVAMNLFVAMPRLVIAGAWSEFFWLLLCMTAVPALGAAVTTTDMGVWDKVELYPLNVRWLFMAGMFGLFVVTPLGFLCAARDAWVRRDQRFPHTCVEARSWLNKSGVFMLVMALFLKAGTALSCNVGLSPSIIVEFIVIVKIAAEYDTEEWVNLSLLYRQPRLEGHPVAESARVKSVPISCGSLGGLFSLGGMAVMLVRAVEIASSVASVAVFHAGFREWLTIGSVSFGGFLLITVRTFIHDALFQMYDPVATVGVGGKLRAVLACCFCPTSLLDISVPALPHYLVLSGQLLLLAVFLAVASTPPGIPGGRFEAVALTILTAVGVPPLVLVVRGVMGSAGPGGAGRAKLFAAEVKAGAVPDLPIEENIARHPRFQHFARQFTGAYFGPALQMKGGDAKLDFQNSGLDLDNACVAFGLVAPLLRNARSMELNCEGTHATDRFFAALLPFFPPAVSALEVNLAGTQVGDASLIALVEALPVRLRTLEVGFNSTFITDEGLAAFAKGLPQGLVSLDAIFYNTKIGDQGVIALARALPKGLTNLRTGLIKTEVGDVGVQAIAHYMPETVITFKADLSGTKVTDLGANALAQVVPDLDQLQSFQTSVSGTQVSEAMKQRLKELSKATAAAAKFQPRQNPGLIEVPNFPGSPSKTSNGYCCSLFPFCNRDQQDLDSVL